MTGGKTQRAPRVLAHAGAVVTIEGRMTAMDSNTFREEAREWAEAIAGTLGAAAFVVGGVVLPGVLDAVCPALFDALGWLACLAFFVGGPAWLLTRK